MQLSKNNNQILGIFLIICATFLLSVRSILVKLAYHEQIAVLDLFYLRFLITVPLLILFAFYKSKKNLLLKICDRKTLLSCSLAGFFGYYLATLSDFYSLKLINANINRIILYTFPIYVIIWNCFIIKKLPSKSDILTFFIIQTSLLFVLEGFNNNFSSSNIQGIYLALIAAISYSIYIVINQQIGKKLGSILFTTYAVSISFIFINIHFFFISQNANLNFDISLNGYLIIISMAVFCTFLPLLLISEGIKQIGATRFSMLNTTGPVITITLCYFILNETMTMTQIFSSLIIIITLFITEKIKLSR
ncbi:MAG: DMT family transporter [Rickettsiales bacterium]|nr:DMT family transporter [Rickettsiales bacterium]